MPRDECGAILVQGEYNDYRVLAAYSTRRECELIRNELNKYLDRVSPWEVLAECQLVPYNPELGKLKEEWDL